MTEWKSVRIGCAMTGSFCTFRKVFQAWQALAETGAKNNGIVQRSDLTGFNFAEVPTILIEMGFLSNPDEDARMETEEYRDKLAQGICNGIIDYFASVSDNQ